MNEKNRPVLVTTDADLWNSADEAHFFVSKGMVKPLPEVTTPIIEDGLEQGLLREATPDEISKYNYEQEMEMALRDRKFKAGNNYAETMKKYQEYLLSQKEEIKMVNDTTNDDALALKEEGIPVANTVVKEVKKETKKKEKPVEEKPVEEKPEAE